MKNYDEEKTDSIFDRLIGLFECMWEHTEEALCVGKGFEVACPLHGSILVMIFSKILSWDFEGIARPSKKNRLIIFSRIFSYDFKI